MHRDKYKGIRNNSSIKQCIFYNKDEGWNIHKKEYTWHETNKTCVFCTKCLSHRCKGDGAIITTNNKALSKQKGEWKRRSKLSYF